MPHRRAKRSIREQQRKERGTDLAPSGGIHGTSISTERIPKSAARVLDAARIRAEFRQKRARLQTDDADANDGMSASKPPPPKKHRTNAGEAEAGKSGKTLMAKGKDKPVGTIEIQPGESLKHFNRRVEDHMRPLVRSAVRASAATERKAKKAATATASSNNKNANNTRQASRASPPSTTRNSLKAHAEDAPPLSSEVRARRDDDDSPKEFATTSSSAPRRLNDVALAPPELKKLPRGVAKHSSSGGKAKASAAAGVLSMAQRAMMEVERENAIRRYREMKERKERVGDRTLLQGEERVDGG